MSTPQNLAAAWAERADRAAAQLRHMKRGFALFRPEIVEQTQREYLHAVQQVRYWSGIGAR